ncbi:MAG: ABC transporter permease subunit [Alphaproteobacteria bacterium]|nr:ABC transporter permease subunit [Alphaproteobacteria bacterium]
MSRAATWRLAVIGGLVLLLEGLTRGGMIAKTTLIPPSVMAVALVDLLGQAKVRAEIAGTLGNVALAALCAILGGFVLGAVLHAVPRLRRAVEPLLATWYAVPFFMFYPLLVVLFGLGDLPVIAVGVAFAIVAMIVNALNGLDRIPRVLGKVARVHRLGRVRRGLLIDLPAAAPQLFTGIKLAVAYSFIGVIASEFIMSGAGLGHAIAFAYNNFDNRTMYGLMLLVLALVTAINMSLHAWEQRELRRRRRS